MEFKSPTRKIVAFLKRSRDNWKARHHAVKGRLRQVEHQLRAVEASRRKWRNEAQSAQAELQSCSKKRMRNATQ